MNYTVDSDYCGKQTITRITDQQDRLDLCDNVFAYQV